MDEQTSDRFSDLVSELDKIPDFAIGLKKQAREFVQKQIKIGGNAIAVEAINDAASSILLEERLVAKIPQDEETIRKEMLASRDEVVKTKTKTSGPNYGTIFDATITSLRKLAKSEHELENVEAIEAGKPLGCVQFESYKVVADLQRSAMPQVPLPAPTK